MSWIRNPPMRVRDRLSRRGKVATQHTLQGAITSGMESTSLMSEWPNTLCVMVLALVLLLLGIFQRALGL
jgi:hypothetical protein